MQRNFRGPLEGLSPKTKECRVRKLSCSSIWFPSLFQYFNTALILALAHGLHEAPFCF